MRRPAGSKKEVAPGVWRLQVSAGTDPITGKRHRPSKIFHGDERESDLELARMLASTGRRSTNALTVWDYIERMYLPSIEPPVLRRRTVDEYRAKLERYVKPSAIASVRLDRFDGYAANTWWRTVLGQVENKQTQLHIYNALSGALTKAVKWGLMERNVLRDAIDPPKPEKHRAAALTEDVANDYLDAFAGHPQEPLVVLAIGGGLRPCEIHGLEWQDIDFDTGAVTIDKGLHERKDNVWLEPPKSVTSKRTITLPAWAVESLRPHRGIGRIIGEMKPSRAVWRYKRHIEASGLPWCPLENLRHTSATIGAERGIPLEDVADRLGHVDTRMARGRYVRRNVTRDARAAEVMESFRRAK